MIGTPLRQDKFLKCGIGYDMSKRYARMHVTTCGLHSMQGGSRACHVNPGEALKAPDM